MSTLTEFVRAACFIETGLGGGATLRLALQQPFRVLHCIEIDDLLIARAAIADPRLTIHHGSSPAILPRLCDPAMSTMFWLDAHYAAGAYTGDAAHDRAHLDARYGQCPLLAELAVIRAVPWQVWPTIYIDDAECFQLDPYVGTWASFDRHQFPRPAEILAALPRGYRMDQTPARRGGGGHLFRAVPAEEVR